MHLREIEGLDQFVAREKLLVALAPAEAREIIAQRRRQIAHRAIGVDAERAVALGELGAVGAWISGIWAKAGVSQPSAS